MCVAATASRFSELADSLWVFQGMKRRWDLTETESSAERTGKTKSRKKCPTQCGLCGFTIGKKGGAGQEKGCDGGKKINGRKRTILLDYDEPTTLCCCP